MTSVVFKSKSKENLALLVQLAQKLGIEVSVLNDKDLEDLALVHAIDASKTGELMTVEEFKALFK